MYSSRLKAKFTESLKAVLPIMGIVLILSFSIAPMPSSILLTFIFGGMLLIAGMMLFSLGAELAMEPMGNSLGAGITKTRKLPLILFSGLVLGVTITVSEPDLQVLANQVLSIPRNALILSVAAGVGLFLVLALVRTLTGLSIKKVLLICYAAVFVLTIFVPKSFLAVAFDSGGVTTGPMTVPFIMAFGIGISTIRTDKKAADDSFGLIALCSVGPILAVLILSLVYSPENAEYALVQIPEIAHSVELRALFTTAIPSYLGEIALALLPIAAIFGIFQLAMLRLGKGLLTKILVGLVYTYAGLVLFLTGANVGFMPAGSYLGETLAVMSQRWILVPIGMLMGYFIVKAEPAVYVLEKQVEEITNGAVTGKALGISLSVGVAASVGIAMIRVLTGIPVLWFVGIGYAAAIAMSFFAPDIFTAIAFDSGGVASGPMTAAFLLPLAEGACIALGGNVVTDAFGVVAMVAMTPLLTIQAMGIIYKFRTSRREAPDSPEYGEFTIIEL